VSQSTFLSFCAPLLAAATWGVATPAAAAPSGLTLDKAHPPERLSGDLVRFPAGDKAAVFSVLPGVVVHTHDRTPPVAGARSLGGRSWHVAVSSVDEAVHLALELTHQPGIDAVFPDVRHDARPMSDDPNREGQWYLDLIEMDALHAVSMGDGSVRVAVIDSGIDIDHPDLVDRVDAPYDAHSDDNDPSPDPDEYCYGGSGICDEHGTAVAGVVAATANNGVGIRGMCPECTLIPIKMLGEDGGSLSADVAAFEHAIAEDAAVINNSWGFNVRTSVPAPLAAVISRAATETRDGKGSVVVFAAGNDNREIGDEELQALPEVLCVSAIDNYGYSTSYTNFGPSVDIAAPSATVSISPIDDLTTDFGGTSAAAPVVAGLAAWILSVAPELTAEEVSALIVDTATESPFVTHDADGHHDIYGHGIITPTAVLDALTDSEPDTGTPDSGTPDDADGGDDDGSTDKGGCATVSGTTMGSLWIVVLGLLGLTRRTPARLRTAR